jgi:hypothetical protein
MTQQVIDIILNSSQCMDSIKFVNFEDYKDITQLGLIYQARFGAFIRVKHGHIVLNLVDWDKVAQAIQAAI